MEMYDCFTLLPEFFYQCNYFFNCLWSGVNVFRGHGGTNVSEKRILIPVQTFFLNFSIEL